MSCRGTNGYLPITSAKLTVGYIHIYDLFVKIITVSQYKNTGKYFYEDWIGWPICFKVVAENRNCSCLVMSCNRANASCIIWAALHSQFNVKVILLSHSTSCSNYFWQNIRGLNYCIYSCIALGVLKWRRDFAFSLYYNAVTIDQDIGR